MITILAMGQSNALGNQSGGNSTFDSNVTVWDNANSLTDLSALGSAFLAPALGSNPLNPAGSNTMMIQVANHLAIKTGEAVRLILVATGGQAIDAWVSSSGVKAAMYNRMEAVLAAAGVSSVDLFLWHQGEADNGGPASNAYPTRWGYLLANLQTDGYIGAGTPIVIGEVAAQYTSINPVLNSIAAADSRVAIALIKNQPTAADNIHFTGAAQDAIGQLYAQALSDMAGHSYSGFMDATNTPEPTPEPCNTPQVTVAVCSPIPLDEYPPGTTINISINLA